MTPFVTGVRRSGEREEERSRAKRGTRRGSSARARAHAGRDEERGGIIADWNSSWPELTCRVHQQIARLVYVSFVAARQPPAFFLRELSRFLPPLADLAAASEDVIGPRGRFITALEFQYSSYIRIRITYNVAPLALTDVTYPTFTFL